MAVFLGFLYYLLDKISAHSSFPDDLPGPADSTSKTIPGSHSAVDFSALSDKVKMAPEFFWKRDSTAFQVNCRIRFTAKCLDTLDSFSPALGRIINTLVREKLQSVSNRHSNQLKLTFQTGGKGAVPRLQTVEISADGKKQTYQAVFEGPLQAFPGLPDKISDYCDSQGECLLSQRYSFPLKTGKVNLKNPKDNFFTTYWPNPEICFKAQNNLPVKAIAVGRIVEIAAVGQEGQALKIYHGRGLYSYYKNLGTLVEGILLGDRVHRDDILGSTGGQRGGFCFSAEKNGIFIEPWSIF